MYTIMSTRYDLAGDKLHCLLGTFTDPIAADEVAMQIEHDGTLGQGALCTVTQVLPGDVVQPLPANYQ